MHKFNHVVLWKVDRLGRSPLHMFQVIEEWKKLGISFTVTTLGIDTSTPMGKFVFGLLAQVAELERQFNIERTKSAMDRIKKSIETKGYYITKNGKKITSIGRPKGRRDNKPRRKSGYYLRHGKKGFLYLRIKSFVENTKDILESSHKIPFNNYISKN